MTLPLRHLVPFDNENRWSDLLAVFIERDPRVAAVVFGWPETDVVADREARAEGRDRIDPLVKSNDKLVGVIEVKVWRCVRKKTRPLPKPTLIKVESMASKEYDPDELFSLNIEPEQALKEFLDGAGAEEEDSEMEPEDEEIES